MVTEITQEQIESKSVFIDGSLCVIMFFGSTCGPCKATIPHYETSALFYKSLGAKINCYKINAWEPETQAEYCKTVWNVTGVPHFKLFYGDKEIYSKVGGGDEPTIKKMIHDGIDNCFKLHGAKI